MPKPFIITVAPMMDYTDRHDRYLLRLIAPQVRLYTEMVTTAALIHGDPERLLAYHQKERYLALQLGGSNPEELAYCAKLGERAQYDEINLNVGCPSSRVKAGRFGACLMREPILVKACLEAMRDAVNIPVTVKCRIGIDELDSYEALHRFVEIVASSGCDVFILHARKAWLEGLSPKENREIPPLQYDRVWRLKQDFPHLTIMINGGLQTLADIKAQEGRVDGVMIGRAAYHNPYLLAEVNKHYFPEDAILSRREIVRAYLPYIDQQLQAKVRLSTMARHMLGLYHSQSGGARWRRKLSEEAHKPGAGIEVIEKALMVVEG